MLHNYFLFYFVFVSDFLQKMSENTKSRPIEKPDTIVSFSGAEWAEPSSSPKPLNLAKPVLVLIVHGYNCLFA